MDQMDYLKQTEEERAKAQHRALSCSVPMLCSASCPKCGSEDINRRHRNRTEKWDKLIGDQSTRSNEFVTMRKYETVCDKECITHHCRTCQYRWETGVLPNEVGE